MFTTSKVKIPSYRQHKASGQGVVTLPHKTYYLGKFKSPESLATYRQLISEWLVGGHRVPNANSNKPVLSMNELCLAYWNYSQEFHGWGKHDGYNLKDALRIVKESFGETSAAPLSVPFA
jgi:hypothetical protein